MRILKEDWKLWDKQTKTVIVYSKKFVEEEKDFYSIDDLPFKFF